MKLKTTHRFDIGRNIGYSHSATVKLCDREGMLFLTTPGVGVDPGEELFHYKGIQNTWLVMFDMDGNKLWEKELPDGVLPGIWFRCAVALDMDGDGYDEIYFINDTGAPFSFMHRKLQRLNALTGEVTGSWPWPWNTFNQRMSLCYRFYLVAGYAHGKPVLVTCQGTYGDMYLQGWTGDMEKIWDIMIPENEFGPKASHVTPVLDINEDGVDELFWGERLLSIEDGHEVICLAPNYDGHSDIILPYRHPETKEWYIYTCREGGEIEGEPRVVTFRPDGSVAWQALRDTGHMHTGWAANVLDGYGKICMAMREHFVPDDSGFNHEIDGVFYYDAYTGEEVDFKLPYKGYEVHPLDVNGDGYHEFVCPDGKIIDRHGEVLASFDGSPMRMGKLLNHPGEQIMIANGTAFEILADEDAVDSEIMKQRYSIPYLTFMQKLMASGYNAIGSQISCGI